MLELNDYMKITAKRNDSHVEWLDVRIEIIGHKPTEQLQDSLDLMYVFIHQIVSERFNEACADTAMLVFSDAQNLIPLDESKLPIVREYPLHMEDLRDEKQLEEALLIKDVMNPSTGGFLTEETVLLIEAIRFIRDNLPYVDYWEVSDTDFWNWDDQQIWSDYFSHSCCCCGKCRHCTCNKH